MSIVHLCIFSRRSHASPSSDYFAARKEDVRGYRIAKFYVLRAHKSLMDYERGHPILQAESADDTSLNLGGHYCGFEIRSNRGRTDTERTPRQVSD